MNGDEIIPLVLGAIFFMIPIVAILTSHQQKMAKIMRQNADTSSNAQIEQMRVEMEALRQLVMQQTIAIDNLSSQRGQMQPQTPPVTERLQQHSNG